VNLYALKKAAAVRWLTELDPDWHERFAGDWQRAEAFYRPKRTVLVNGGSGVQPAEYDELPERDPDDIDFDSDLEDQ
jgi:hypothetical protein